MQIIRRDGIAIRIPPDVTSAGGEATAAYVAELPADLFPPVPEEYRGKDQGPALAAYLEELEQLGALATFQARADARYAFDVKAFREKEASERAKEQLTKATVDPAVLEQARAAARRVATPEPIGPDSGTNAPNSRRKART